jgi:Domain of unknown function (DUF4062)
MDKRYQIFVSSTFEDLKPERQAVLRAILELNHMPAGMEFFPASDETAWKIIQDIIEESDYYLLIIGGRYGSLDEEGLGFTEKEYDFATTLGKPIIPLLHEVPDSLPRIKTETNQQAWEKLKIFREKVKSRHTCAFWNTPEELKVKVVLGLVSIIKQRPGIGWARADLIPEQGAFEEILKLKNQIDDLQHSLNSTRDKPPEGTEELSQGDDKVLIRYQVTISSDSQFNFGNDDRTLQQEINITWNRLFAVMSPHLIEEASEPDMKSTVVSFIENEASKEIFKQVKEWEKVHSLAIIDEDFQTIKIQFRALGLISKSDRARSIKDRVTYWTLTHYGNSIMMRLRAIKKG